MNSILFFPYFGNIEFFNVLKNSNEYVFEICDTYPKQTYRNRTQILGSNGILDLSIPVKKPNGSKSKTSEIKIDYSENWQKSHLKSIESAYKNSPFYDYYIDNISALILSKEETLIEKNELIIKRLAAIIGFSINVEITKEYLKESDWSDYRTTITPKSISNFDHPPYIQVFSDRFEFKKNLSILDLLFNEGPNTISFL
jgi:hypothetical protein